MTDELIQGSLSAINKHDSSVFYQRILKFNWLKNFGPIMGHLLPILGSAIKMTLRSSDFSKIFLSLENLKKLMLNYEKKIVKNVFADKLI